MDLDLENLKLKRGEGWGYYYTGYVYVHARVRPEEKHLKYYPRLELLQFEDLNLPEGFMIYTTIKQKGKNYAEPSIDFVKIR